MYIERDITAQLINSRSSIQIVIGPRQCGKSTLLSHLSTPPFTEVTFDDFQMRHLANQDPSLFLSQYPPPLLLDEVQYVPALFPEIKLRVDAVKKARLFEKNAESIPILFRMTGSNQVLMDKQVKESLVGRASYFYLNTCSIHELQKSNMPIDVSAVLFKGGWPELYIDPLLSPVQYLNDYIRSYIEKDIVLSAGIQKQTAFHTVLSLLAARTGMLLDYSNIAQHSTIQSVTVKEWVSLLERTALLYCLRPYATNLNKRLIKSPKCYFLDTGLAVRLQGWQMKEPLLISPQAGALFETLVCSELYKFINNTQNGWQLYFWRTKEGEEIDFVIITNDGRVLALDAKMSIQSTKAISIPPAFKKVFPQVNQIIIVTFGGKTVRLSSESLAVPIQSLYDFFTR
jgi:uncharacterized protein